MKHFFVATVVVVMVRSEKDLTAFRLATTRLLIEAGIRFRNNDRAYEPGVDEMPKRCCLCNADEANEDDFDAVVVTCNELEGDYGHDFCVCEECFVYYQ